MTKRVLFVLAALILLAAGLYLRTGNTKTAQTQADRLVAKDVAGSDITADLTSLKSYVKTHMGASVGFTLKGSYTRAQAAATAAASVTATNSQIYADAQRLCSGKSDSITQAKCNENYLSTHLIAISATAPVAAPKSIDYQYTLKAPLWTPDLPGALLLGTAAALIVGFLLTRRSRY